MGAPSPTGAASLRAALAARQQVREWAAGAEMLALLRACAEAGWFAELRDAVAAAELAQRLQVAPARAEDVLQALLAGGVVTLENDRYALTTPFAALAGGESGMSLEPLLAGNDMQCERIRAIVAGAPDAPLDADQALVIARSSGPHPTEGARELYRSAYGALGPLHDRLSAGGRHLDVGCGIGGGLLCAAALYPGVDAVGIEIVPEVAAETRRRAHAAGLADRVEVRVADARELNEQQSFDTAFWAHPFFREDGRAAVLASIRRALVPGGLLVMQELHPPPPAGTPRPLRAALDRAFDRSLGLPHETSAEQLVEETTAAGFAHVVTQESPLGRLVLVRRP